jgi:hypothetical protein
MRLLLHNWRILLGGVASASVLAVGVAGPTLTRPVSRASDRATSALTGVAPIGSAARGVGCDLPGLLQAGLVISALAGAPVAPCGFSDTTNVPSHATSAIPGLSAVTSAIPGLPTVTSALLGLPDLGSVTASTGSISGRQLSAGSLTGSLAGASAVTGALSGLGGLFGGAEPGSQQP